MTLRLDTDPVAYKQCPTLFPASQASARLEIPRAWTGSSRWRRGRTLATTTTMTTATMTTTTMTTATMTTMTKTTKTTETTKTSLTIPQHKACDPEFATIPAIFIRLRDTSKQSSQNIR